MSQIEIFPTDFMDQPMLALSWYMPYGFLMLHYGKDETRTWPTNYRGLVLLCATKVPCSETKLVDYSGGRQMERIAELLKGREHEMNALNGHAFALGRLSDCFKMQREHEDKCFVNYKEPWKKLTKRGKLRDVRLWIHRYSDMKPIEPFPWIGTQGWAKVSQEQKSNIKLLTAPAAGGEGG